MSKQHYANAIGPIRLAPALAVLPALVIAGCARTGITGLPDEGQAGAPEGKSLTVDLRAGVAMVVVYISPGTFTMGSTEEELNTTTLKKA